MFTPGFLRTKVLVIVEWAASLEPVMNPRIAEIFAHIKQLEEELQTEIGKTRALRGFTVKGKRVRFEKQIERYHKSLRLGLFAFFKDTHPVNLITAPLIYSMIIPIALLDAWATLYQHVYFRANNIRRVARSEYVVFDRNHLRYLNRIEALNCLYCGYANGVIAYAREIASRTEQYWCPIKHALRIRDPHHRYFQFAEYGDAEGYRSRLEEFRRQLQDIPTEPPRP